MKTISKSEAAARWSIAPSMVTKYIVKGMPQTKTGRLIWPEVERWRKANISPERSGSYQARQRKADKPELSCEGLDLEFLAQSEFHEDRDQKAYRNLLDTILSYRNLVPFVLAELGVRDPALLHASDDIFAALVIELAGDLAPYDWLCDDIPFVDVDYDALAARYGLPFLPETVEAADKMAAGVCDSIQKNLEKEK